MRLKPETLADITTKTLANYNGRAEIFREGTRDHDVSQNIGALLRAVDVQEGDATPRTILDLGCGPGRDLRTFSRLGHRAIGLDGTERFVAMARQDSSCEVWHQDFLHLQLPGRFFDGVFANAVLFHVPTQELPRVLAELYATLKPGGVLFSSNPRGDNTEGWKGERYGVWHDWPGWRALMTRAGFVEIEHFYRPEGQPFEQQPWLASVWRRPDDTARDASAR